MVGVEMAELALSWRRLQHRDRLLTNIVSFFVLMGLFAFTLNGGAIDQLGHLGGLICGQPAAAAVDAVAAVEVAVDSAVTAAGLASV